MDPDTIIKESFQIIEREIGTHSFGPMEWAVVRRIIHASGDIQIASLVHFQSQAVKRGIDALKLGCHVVTDVQMVAAGIQAEKLALLGGLMHCFLNDRDSAGHAPDAGVTRSALGIKKAVLSCPNAIYVIGNAPTALLTLCEAIREGQANPPLVIAMPVGFVKVLESKEEILMLHNQPAIIVKGRRGGSAMAVAAFNALVELVLS